MLLATLTARDSTRGKGWNQETAPNSRPLSEQIGGALNPTWCEWFMGFPMGFTDVEPSETQSFRNVQKSSDGS